MTNLFKQVGCAKEFLSPLGDDMSVVSDSIIEVPSRLRDLRLKLKHAEKIGTIITGLSGAGKTSISKILPFDKYCVIKTTTTRKEIRGDETETEPYDREQVETFLARRDKGEFLETVQYGANYYGTPNEKVQQAIDSRKIPVFVVDPKGGETILQKAEQNEAILRNFAIISFFIVAEGPYQIARRLVRREREFGSKEEWKTRVKGRVGQIEDDLGRIGSAHFIIINRRGKLPQTTQTITEIMDKFRLELKNDD